MKSQEEQELCTQVEQVRGRLESLAADLRVVDEEVESLAPQRETHELLDQVCGSLEKLDELGAASLFWGDRSEAPRVEEQLAQARTRVSAFQKHLGQFDERRQAILENIGQEEGKLEILGEDLYDLREEEERRKLEWVVEREISPMPRRAQLLAWARGGEDDWRFRKVLAASMGIGLLLGAVLPMISLPLPKRFEPTEMPRRLAQLVRQEQAKALPPPPVVPEERPDQPDQPEPEAVEEPQPSQEPEEVPREESTVAAAEPDPSQAPPGGPGPLVAEEPPRRRVEKAGILAFRDEFASLAKDDVAPRLGAEARYGDADEASSESQDTSRSMLTTNAPGSSGGINLASLSRNVGGGGGDGTGDGTGGGGGGIQGVPLGRATSSIDAIGGGGGRPLARAGAAASRTDEEIQIVFDRYKASFYRLYNRELRKDPTLQGQMVLRLTIEPDGSVSMCVLQSSDMAAPELADQVVDRVLTINFGPKEGVKTLTIAYPIDFLPAG